MDFIAEYGFDIKQGQERDFQRWLSENESKLAAAMPSGVEYIGTYAVVSSSEKDSGAVRQLLRMESYGSQDTMAAALKEGGPYATLFGEMFQFIDRDKGAGWCQSLYKAVTDVSLVSEA